MADTLAKTQISARPRILAADDDPIMREMMMARLGDDVDVVVAENGQVAWEKLADERFDLAIIDLAMPELDGFGLIQYLRQTPSTIDLPIIVATSRGDKDAIERAFNSGASGFVTKPINWSLFKYEVQFVLKAGKTEKELRATRTDWELNCRIKENLLGLMSHSIRKQEQGLASSTDLGQLSDAIELSDLLAVRDRQTQEATSANDFIEGVLTGCAPDAEVKAVKLLGRKSLAEVLVKVDQKTWHQAMIRLVKRAIRVSPPGGTVELLLGSQQDGSLVFTVRDNGQASDLGDLETRLTALSTQNFDFETTSLVLELDLQIIKQTVENYGGRFLFQNMPGQGNVCALWLPANVVKIIPLEQIA